MSRESSALRRLLLVALLCASACGNEVIRFTLLRSTPEEPGPTCPYGGVRFDAGIDRNGDGVLQPEEVESTAYTCGGAPGLDGTNGTNGTNSLTVVTPEPAGPNCPNGGSRIQSGQDRNGDRQLQTTEVTSTSYACSGAPGRDGTNGTNGSNGLTSLVKISAVPPDPQGPCLYGGTRIDAGLDHNRNGFLDPAEIDETQYVCSVHVNPNLTLVVNTPEPPGSNCQYGGVKTQVGYDANNDRILEESEVSSTTYLCNVVVLLEGKSALVRTRQASPSQCPFGGAILETGVDDNRNNVLDPTEVRSTELLCNGRDGLDSLVVATEYSGLLCGAEGGWKFEVGLDLDRDRVLDPSEIQATSYLCHGRDGFLGYDGHNSLIRMTADHAICPAGGVKIETGLDQNDNGSLDAGEVQNVGYACNGVDGFNSLVNATANPSACGALGGMKYEVGLDRNRSGFLDWSEVQSTAYICNGAQGQNSLIRVSDAGSSCGSAGGYRYEVGLDTNRNDYLDYSEIETTSYVCHGQDGANSLVRLEEASSWDCPNGGIIVKVGLDSDGDGYLDYSEVQQSATLCSP